MDEANRRNENIEAENGAALNGLMRRIAELESHLEAEKDDNNMNRATIVVLQTNVSGHTATITQLEEKVLFLHEAKSLAREFGSKYDIAAAEKDVLVEEPTEATAEISNLQAQVVKLDEVQLHEEFEFVQSDGQEPSQEDVQRMEREKDDDDGEDDGDDDDKGNEDDNGLEEKVLFLQGITNVQRLGIAIEKVRQFLHLWYLPTVSRSFISFLSFLCGAHPLGKRES